jgi:hypothetical protein
MKNGNYIEATGIKYSGFFSEHSKSKIQLQPIYEAFTNSLEAIKESLKIDNFIKSNQITIDLKFNPNLLSSEYNDYELYELIIEDNGIGFNDNEFKRFQNLYDNSKTYFNHGSGRVQYMQFFEKIEFESVYKDEKSNTGYFKRIFTLSKSQSFLKNNSIIYHHEPEEIEMKNAYTKVTFKEPLQEKDKKFYNKLTTNELKQKIISHYLDYFCENRDNLPSININRYESENLKETIEITLEDIPLYDKQDIAEIEYRQLSADGKTILRTNKKEVFFIKAFKINEKTLQHNDIKFTSKHEIIEGDIADKFKLEILKPDDVINNNRYLFLISSDYIDKLDNENNIRGNITISTEEEFKKSSPLLQEEVILLDDIQNQINNKILNMYNEILEITNKHKQDIDRLQEMFLLDKETLKSIKINVQDTDETILKKVYKADAKLIAEKDASIKEQIDKINELNPTSNDYQNELRKRTSSLVKAIPLQNRTALTHTVARRNLVLELFEKTLNSQLLIQQSIKDNKEREKDEKLLHNLIFQQSSDKTDESDLWLVNEDFIYFKGTSESNLGDIEFNGELILKEKLSNEEEEYRLKQEGDAKQKRPDILLFPSEGKCILIELKAPKVNVSDHLNQLNKYASLINNLSKDKYKFTTFYGYLVGENIDIDDIEDNDTDFISAYDFDYIFRPYKRISGKFGKQDASLYTEIVKYSTLLKRAKNRNKIFINKLMGNSK